MFVKIAATPGRRRSIRHWKLTMKQLKRATLAT
jgi:hypothetical protein